MNESEMEDSLYLCVTAIRCISQHLLTMFSSLDILEYNQPRNSLDNNQRYTCYCDCIQRCSYLQNSDHLEFVSNIISESSSSIDDCFHCSKCGSLIHEISNQIDSTSNGDYINIDKHFNLASKYNTCIPFSLTLKNMATSSNQDKYFASKFHKLSINKTDKQQQTSQIEFKNGEIHRVKISKDGDIEVGYSGKNSILKTQILPERSSDLSKKNLENIDNEFNDKKIYNENQQYITKSQSVEKDELLKDINSISQSTPIIEIMRSFKDKSSSQEETRKLDEQLKFVGEYFENNLSYNQETEPFDLDSQYEVGNGIIDQITISSQLYTPTMKYSINENLKKDNDHTITIGDTIYSPFHSEKNSEIENLKNEFIATDLYVKEFYLNDEINDFNTITGSRSDSKQLFQAPDSIQRERMSKTSIDKIPEPKIVNKIPIDYNEISHHISSRISIKQSIPNKESTTQTLPSKMDIYHESQRNSKNQITMTDNYMEILKKNDYVSNVIKPLTQTTVAVSSTSIKRTINNNLPKTSIPTKLVTSDSLIRISKQNSSKLTDKLPLTKKVLSNFDKTEGNSYLTDLNKGLDNTLLLDSLIEKPKEPDGNLQKNMIENGNKVVSNHKLKTNQNSKTIKNKSIQHRLSSELLNNQFSKPPSVSSKSHSNKVKVDASLESELIKDCDVFVITDSLSINSQQNIGKFDDKLIFSDEIKTQQLSSSENRLFHKNSNEETKRNPQSDISSKLLLSPIKELQIGNSAPENDINNRKIQHNIQAEINNIIKIENVTSKIKEKLEKLEEKNVVNEQFQPVKSFEKTLKPNVIKNVTEQQKTSKNSSSNRSSSKIFSFNYKSDMIDVHMKLPFEQNVHVKTNESIGSNRKTTKQITQETVKSLKTIETDNESKQKSSKNSKNSRVEHKKKDIELNFKTETRNENEIPFSVNNEKTLFETNLTNLKSPKTSEQTNLFNDKSKRTTNSESYKSKNEIEIEKNNKLSPKIPDQNLDSNNFSAYKESDNQNSKTNETDSTKLSNENIFNRILKQTQISSSTDNIESIINKTITQSNQSEIDDEKNISIFTEKLQQFPDKESRNSSNFDNFSRQTTTWTTSGQIIKSTNVLIKSDNSLSTSFFLPIKTNFTNKKQFGKTINLPSSNQNHHLLNKIPNSFCTVDLLLSSSSLNNSEYQNQLSIINEKFKDKKILINKKENEITFESDLFSCIIDESVTEKSNLYSQSNSIFIVPDTPFSKEENHINSTKNVCSNELSHESSLYINVILFNSPVITQICPKSNLLKSKKTKILSKSIEINNNIKKKHNLKNNGFSEKSIDRKNDKTFSQFRRTVEKNLIITENPKYSNKNNLFEKMTESSNRKYVDISILLSDYDEENSCRSIQTLSNLSNSHQSLVLEALLLSDTESNYMKYKRSNNKIKHFTYSTEKSPISCFDL